MRVSISELRRDNKVSKAGCRGLWLAFVPSEREQRWRHWALVTTTGEWGVPRPVGVCVALDGPGVAIGVKLSGQERGARQAQGKCEWKCKCKCKWATTQARQHDTTGTRYPGTVQSTEDCTACPALSCHGACAVLTACNSQQFQVQCQHQISNPPDSSTSSKPNLPAAHDLVMS